MLTKVNTKKLKNKELTGKKNELKHFEEAEFKYWQNYKELTGKKNELKHG